MPIVYKTGSLFDAPKGSVLVHACNGQGIWGSGIAKQFHERFPESYEQYRVICTLPDFKIGEAFVLNIENEYRVGCLVTSGNYGQLRDTKDQILKNTRTALLDILGATNKLSCFIVEGQEIHSCKFNAGLFGVPWEETEKILLDVMKEVGYNNIWTVWSPNQGETNA
jgi:ADP-ribose 1''-phosphate phosphatase